MDDYHRYSYPEDAVKSENIKIPGIFHTVNPIANDHYPIYKENTREYCLLKTEAFGTLLMMEVGALLVGKIDNRETGRASVKRGEEKGNFAFGGSAAADCRENRNSAGNLRTDGRKGWRGSKVTGGL